MDAAPLPRERKRGWYTAFVLFLACLVPLSPLLAQVQGDARIMPPSKGESEQVTHLYGGRLPAALIFRDLLAGASPAHAMIPGFPVPPEDNACKSGGADGQRESSGVLYYCLGLTTMIWGPLLAYVITPSVPDQNTRGMSAKAAASYAECYKEAAKAVHVKWAWYGLGTLAVLSLLIFVIVMAGNTKMSN